MTEHKDLEGLGGWLILVGLGIIGSPLIIIGTVLPVYSALVSTGAWSVLTTPDSEAYHPLWAPILIGEIAVNGALVVAWVYAAFLFFSKRTAFPRFYIGLMLFTLAFILVDAVAIKTVLPDEPLFDPETAKQFGRSLIASLIWIPYMLVSKRVKATFVR